MKILCVSDTVMPPMESAANLRRRYSDIELVISCGDMPGVYLEFIVSVLNVPLFYVRGNHDERYEREPPGGEDLHGKFLHYKGLNFFGIEGSMQYNDGAIQYTQLQMNAMVMKMGPQLKLNQLRGRNIDVFVAHSPAWGIHDLPDLPHNGFKGFLRFMDWYRPRYMLHGHVHTYDRRQKTRSQYLDTCIINVNPVTVLEISEATTP